MSLNYIDKMTDIDICIFRQGDNFMKKELSIEQLVFRALIDKGLTRKEAKEFSGISDLQYKFESKRLSQLKYETKKRNDPEFQKKRKAAKLKYQESHVEEIRERNHKYYQEHQAELKEYHRNYRKKKKQANNRDV